MTSRINRIILLGLLTLVFDGFSSAHAAAPDKSGVKPESISLPTGPGSIEGLGRSPEPLLNTGAATYSIRLEIPPAAAGHQPTLELRYSSLAGNSDYGIGWSLALPDIRRQTDKGQPTFSDSDTFVYQGEELVQLSDGSFRVENEGMFVRLRPLPDGGWEAREKDGRVLRFGLYPSATRSEGNSREAGPSPDGQQSEFDRTSRWLLDEAVDVNGNLVEYEYTSFPDSPGRLYLDGVRYGLRAEDAPARRRSRPHFAVRFVYEPRDDALSDYRTGYESRLGRRCRTIQVLAYPSPVAEPNGRLIRQYLLDFDASRDGKRAQDLIGLSRLYALEQCDGLGNPLPPIRFTYYDLQIPEENGPARVASVSTVPYVSPSVTTGDTELADVNSDGLPDLILARKDGHSYAPNLGGDRFGLWRDFENAPGVPGVGLGQSGVALLDIDGDGRVELVHRRGGGSKIEDGVVYRRLEPGASPAPGSGTGRSLAPGVRWGDLQPFHSPLSFEIDGPYVQQLDANSDKCIDLLRVDSEGVRVILNRAVAEGSQERRWNVGDVVPYGSTDLADLKLANGLASPNSHQLRRDPTLLFADMNGDRLLDLVQLVVDGKFVQVRVWPSRGNGRFAHSHLLRSRTVEGLFDDLYLGTDPGDRLRLMDVNGDGLSDLVLPSSGIVRLWMNVGGREFAPMRRFAAPEYDSRTRLRQADLNGNGSVDLVWWNPSDGDEVNRLRYLDFCGEARPNLLRSVDNGQGKRVVLEYRSSTDFYVAARDAGEPWTGTLPMPVWVVSKITTFTGVDLDGRLGEDRYVAQFFYRDGYYDGFEKEFHGFAGALRVDWAGEPGPGGASDPTPTRVTRYAYHTGAPDGLDNDADRDRLRDAGRDEEGVYGTDEFNPVAGREEEPLKGKLLWSEVSRWAITSPRILRGTV